jgi:hypothetical protein
VRGQVESADRLGVRGWATAGRLLVSVDGVRVETVLADTYRADLAEIDGAGAFEAWFAPLPQTAVEIAVTTADGVHLPGSPVRLAPAAAFPAGPLLPDAGMPLALVVDEAAPDATRDAGSVALLSHMATLRSMRFFVVFATLAEAEGAVRRTAGRVRVAYLHRLRPMATLAPAIRAANPGVHIVFSVADLAHLRAERQAAVAGTGAPAGLRAAEIAAARAADAVVTHSRIEAVLLERLAVRAHVVPWAVPARPVSVPFAERAGIGFLGSYGHPPNLDAALVLLDTIMPEIWAVAPIPVVLAGHGMPRRLRARAGGLVQILGSLSDTADVWRRVRVSVAPLRFGAGVKGKVLDSFGAGIPCVCSPIAAEGLAVPESLVARDAPAMVSTLLRLHNDAAANARAAAEGLATLAEGHTPSRVQHALAWALAPTGLPAEV